MFPTRGHSHATPPPVASRNRPRHTSPPPIASRHRCQAPWRPPRQVVACVGLAAPPRGRIRRPSRRRRSLSLPSPYGCSSPPQLRLPPLGPPGPRLSAPTPRPLSPHAARRSTAHSWPRNPFSRAADVASTTLQHCCHRGGPRLPVPRGRTGPPTWVCWRPRAMPHAYFF